MSQFTFTSRVISDSNPIPIPLSVTLTTLAFALIVVSQMVNATTSFQFICLTAATKAPFMLTFFISPVMSRSPRRMLAFVCISSLAQILFP